MPTSFTLADATPMDRVIVKVVIGSRPPLDESYFQRYGHITNEIQAYRHVVAHALIAGALKKCLKGLTPNQVREWLSRDSAWLDPNTVDEHRGPLVIGGELPSTQAGIQAVLGAWLENATNCITNIAVGSADVNIHKGASMNPAIDQAKKTWKRPVCHIDKLLSLVCIDVQTGKKKRYQANATFYGGGVDRKEFLEYYWSKEHYLWGHIENGVLMKSVPGTTFELVIHRETIECQGLRMHQGQLFGNRGFGDEPLCMTSDIWDVCGRSRSGQWEIIKPDQIPGYSEFKIICKQPERRLLAIRIDGDGTVSEVSRSFVGASPQNREAAAVKLLEAAIDPQSLHEKVLRREYISERKEKLGAEVVKARDKLVTVQDKIAGAPDPDTLRGRPATNTRANLKRWRDSEASYTNKIALLNARLGNVTNVLSVIQPADLKDIYDALEVCTMEDPRTRMPGAPPTYQSRSVALLALGWKEKYLPPTSTLRGALQHELIAIEQADRVTTGLISRGYRPPVASTIAAPPTPLAGVTSGSARPVKVASVGLTLAYDSDPMDTPIIKVITGDRPDLDTTHLTAKGRTAGEGQDLRHVVAHVLIAKALRVCLKGLTPRQVALWLEKKEAWLDGEVSEKYVKPLRDNVGVDGADSFGSILKTVGTVEAAVDAWLKNASSYSRNLYAGKSSINRSKGASIAPAANALKQIWRRYLCDVAGVTAIRCLDKQSGNGLAFRVLTPGAHGTRVRAIGTAIGREIQETIVAAGTDYDPSTAGPNGVLLCALPGARFQIELVGGTHHQSQAGALLVDRRGHIFQVSREFSLIEKPASQYKLKNLKFPAAHSNNDPELSRHFLKAAIDPSGIQNKTLEKINDEGDITTILNACTSLAINVPRGNGAGGVVLVKQYVVHLALGENEKYIGGADLTKIKTPLQRTASAAVIPRTNTPKGDPSRNTSSLHPSSSSQGSGRGRSTSQPPLPPRNTSGPPSRPMGNPNRPPTLTSNDSRYGSSGYPGQYNNRDRDPRDRDRDLRDRDRDGRGTPRQYVDDRDDRRRPPPQGDRYPRGRYLDQHAPPPDPTPYYNTSTPNRKRPREEDEDQYDVPPFPEPSETPMMMEPPDAQMTYQALDPLLIQQLLALGGYFGAPSLPPPPAYGGLPQFGFGVPPSYNGLPSFGNSSSHGGSSSYNGLPNFSNPSGYGDPSSYNGPPGHGHGGSSGYNGPPGYGGPRYDPDRDEEFF